MSLAILDWGIGGIDFLARLRVRHPGAPVVYWAESGAGPYGKLPRDALAPPPLPMRDPLAAFPPLREALNSNEIQAAVPINYKLKKTT